jgi:thiaminase/transcriptional activator TenA
MLAIARDGGFLDTIAAMFAAEWMYWTWSTEADRMAISDPLLKEWVRLHAEPEFEAQARWLKAVLDEAGETMDLAERKRLSAIFGRAQRLEIDFHEAAYS